MWQTYFTTNSTTGPWFGRLERKPNLAVGLSLLAAALVIVVPLILLFFVGVIVFLVVRATLGVLELVFGTFRVLTGGMSSAKFSGADDAADDGRRNVRVIPRE